MSGTQPAAGSHAEELDPKRWGILAVIVIAQLMVVLDASIVTIALPRRSVRSDLGGQQAVGDHCVHLGFRRFLLLEVASPTSGAGGGCSSSA